MPPKANAAMLARNRTIAQARANGGKLSDLATKYGMTKTSIYQIAKDLGVTDVPRQPHPQKERLVALWGEGKTTAEIADDLGISRSAAKERLAYLGLKSNKAAPVPLWEKISKYIPFSSGCWEWAGRRDRHGYGGLTIDRRTKKAHRVVYEALVGSIPDGMVLDHLCRNPPCVNPQHLDVCTQAENVRRGAIPPRQTHCKKGHPLSGENLRVYRHQRNCRKCQSAYDAARKIRLKAEKLEAVPQKTE